MVIYKDYFNQFIHNLIIHIKLISFHPDWIYLCVFIDW